MILCKENAGFFDHQCLQKELINLVDILHENSQIHEYLMFGVSSLV